VGIVLSWYGAPYHTLGIHHHPTVLGTRAATWCSRLRARRRGPGLKLEINNREETSLRLKVLQGVTGGRVFCAELLSSCLTKSVKDWITLG